jgi:hypothetical protein
MRTRVLLSGKARPKARDDFRQSNVVAQIGLATIQIFGEYPDCDIMIFPGFAGTPARLLGGFCVSRVEFLANHDAGVRRIISNLELIC